MHGLSNPMSKWIAAHKEAAGATYTSSMMHDDPDWQEHQEQHQGNGKMASL
jgi:hypothetical protein